VRKLGALQLVTSMMRKYALDPDIQICACRFFIHMVSMGGEHAEKSRLMIAEAGGVRAIVEALNRFPGHTELLHIGVIALERESQNESKVITEIMLSSNVPQTVLAIMHGDKLRDTVLMDSAIKVVFYILLKFDVNALELDTRKAQSDQARIVRREAIPRILDLLSKNMGHVNTYNNVCGVLIMSQNHCHVPEGGLIIINPLQSMRL
jgi:hypothetical protein